MTIREALIAYLQGICLGTAGLEDVKVIKSARDVDELSSAALIVKTDSYEKLAQAPLRSRTGTFTCTLVSPHADMDRAEADLDARLEVLLPALLTFKLNWTSATQTDYLGRLAFDIIVQSILTQTVDT